MTGDQRTARHEAAHCAGAILGGLDVLEVRVGQKALALADGPSANNPNGLAGVTQFEPPRDDREVRAAAIATILGPITGGKGAPTWPLGSASSDERELSKFAKALNLTASGYDQLVTEARELSETPTFKGLVDGIAQVLEEQRVIGAEKLARAGGVDWHNVDLVATLAKGSLNGHGDPAENVERVLHSETDAAGVREQFRRQTRALLGLHDAESNGGGDLHQKSRRLEREHAEVQTATFAC